jgi:hypothetical protein
MCIWKDLSSYTLIKNEYHNRLFVSLDLRVYLLFVDPDFKNYLLPNNPQDKIKI